MKPMNTNLHKPQVTAHRGLAWDYPENTLIAFEAAIKLAPTYIELDYRTTVDGQLVCIHDDTLNRYLAGAHAQYVDIAIESLTYEQILEVDFGIWKHERFAGIHVATMEQVIDLFNQYAPTGTCPILMIEHKTGTVEQLLQRLETFETTDQYVVQSFHWDFLEKLHQLRPDIRLAALGDGQMDHTQIRQAQAMGCYAIHWDIQITPENITAANNAGLEIWVSTLNHPIMWLGATAIGLDAVTTDRCDKAIAFFQQ